MEDCIFCKIVKGEIPCSKIYEDENIFAFLDIAPVHKGHALVIPKKHFETILDIPENELKELILAVKKIATAVEKGTEADGFVVTMSNRKAAGQVVPHAHFHIIPRYKDDGLKHWPKIEYKEGEMEEVRDKITNQLE
jgi:histidine triad (HIT) family protein